MPDKLGRWPVLLIALALIIGADVSAQVTSAAASPSTRLGLQACLPVSTQVQNSRRVTQNCREYQSPAVNRQDGRHEASDTSQGFTKHLDRNVPAVLLITLVRNPLPHTDVLLCVKVSVHQCLRFCFGCRLGPYPLQLELEEALCLCPFLTLC